MMIVNRSNEKCHLLVKKCTYQFLRIKSVNMDTLIEELFFSSDSDSSSDSSISSDETQSILITALIDQEKPSIKTLNERKILQYTDQEFLSKFRIKRSVCEELIIRFEESSAYKSLFIHIGGKKPLSAEKNILVFLYFVGHDALGYRTINNMFDVSLSTLFKIVNRVAVWLCSLSSEVIQWPNENQMKETISHFENLTEFPGVFGLLDSTNILINKPRRDPDSYIDKKGDYTIHMQGLLNHKKKFIDIFIGYPGSVDNAQVFEDSTLYKKLLENCSGEYILGSTAYPLQPTCLTPYRDNGRLSNKQKHYNEKHSSTRSYIEHSLQFLKKRFRYLNHMKLRKIKLLVLIIKACCVLHNIADPDDLDLLEDDIPAGEQSTGEEECDELVEDTFEGVIFRNDVADELWERLQENSIRQDKDKM